MYKIFAAMIHNRIATKIDHLLMETQYGFRENKSITDAIHIVRRLTHRGFTLQENMHLVLLDCGKAFDKIFHSNRIETMARLNTPTKIINLAKAMYKQPSFFVKADGQCSDTKKHKPGMRQGCPLSPYLFILLMTVMFHDIHKDDKAQAKTQRFEGLISDEVLYADDTICVTKTKPAMNRLINEIEREGTKYGLKLNCDKCEYTYVFWEQRHHYIM